MRQCAFQREKCGRERVECALERFAAARVRFFRRAGLDSLAGKRRALVQTGRSRQGRAEERMWRALNTKSRVSPSAAGRM